MSDYNEVELTQKLHWRRVEISIQLLLRLTDSEYKNCFSHLPKNMDSVSVWNRWIKRIGYTVALFFIAVIFKTDIKKTNTDRLNEKSVFILGCHCSYNWFHHKYFFCLSQILLEIPYICAPAYSLAAGWAGCVRITITFIKWKIAIHIVIHKYIQKIRYSKWIFIVLYSIGIVLIIQTWFGMDKLPITIRRRLLLFMFSSTNCKLLGNIWFSVYYVWDVTFYFIYS